ncbi:hypothetical protein BgiBS90_025801 [Biomphalaria glabrata]|nr:hypothetical protein BgiBS90_025801 [Biomphalaria glabrata]
MASRLSSILRMSIMALFLQLAAAEAEIVSTSNAWAVIPAVLFVVGAIVVVVYVLKGASSDRNPAGNSNSGTNTNTNTSSSTDQNKADMGTDYFKGWFLYTPVVVAVIGVCMLVFVIALCGWFIDWFREKPDRSRQYTNLHPYRNEYIERQKRYDQDNYRNNI